MAVFTIEEFTDSPMQGEMRNPKLSRVTVGSRWDIRFDDTVATRSDLGEWTFIWYGESNTEPDFERVVDLLTSGHLIELWGCRGVLIAASKIDGSIYIFNDGYGSFPIYFNNSPMQGEPVVSDSLGSFADRNIDWVSFYQFLSLGYIFGAYSLFEGVSRLEANHGIKLSCKANTPLLSRFPLKNFWNGSASVSTDDLVDIFRHEAEGFGNAQIMMSGGWDSRLLLAVLEHKKPVLYTHGNLESRESAIVRDIAAVCGLPVIEHSFDRADFEVDLFSNYLCKNESAMFAHWYPAGLHAAQHDLLITAGTFGEVLGGHYGTLNTLPGKKKHASLLMHLIGLGALLDNALNLRNRQTILSYLSSSNYRVFWFVQSQLADYLRSKDLVDQSNRRLSALFESYGEQGMEDAQAMFERFYTEHRGGQYINRQLSNAAQGYRFRNIFTNRELLSASPSIPFSRRAHNKINKEVIKKLSPKLLNFPMAATLANGGRPMILQEASRGVRKVIERHRISLSMYWWLSRYGRRGFGWNDFRSVVSEEWIVSISPLLSDKLWDHEKIVEVVRSNNQLNSYSLFDMISKAITIDNLVKLRI